MKPYLIQPFKLLASIVILLAILWLTLGVSFIYFAQPTGIQEVSGTSNIPTNDSDDETCPLNDAEEQTETCANVFSSDYLKEDFEQLYCSDCPLKHNNRRYSDNFVNFHIESFSPPPEC
jgi:hypothetical protein